MFKKLPVVLTSDQLLDLALSKSRRVTIVDRDPYFQMKKTVISRTESFVGILEAKLTSYVEEFPSLELLHPFYRELLSIELDLDFLRKSLGAVDWSKKTILRIYGSQARFLQKTGNIDFLKSKQKEIYGRIASVLHQVDKNLVFLAKAQNFLRDLPVMQEVPTAVIAGYPNVGKSSLLRQLSHAKPQVAQYPFTTKEISVGHISYETRYEKKSFQVVDTPGLLARPFEDRNDIEKKAIVALRSLADVVVFLFDPSETCGYEMDDQRRMLEDMRSILPDIPFILVENKCDMFVSDSKNVKMSCSSGKNVDVVVKLILEQLEKVEDIEEI